jgi:uncharacterized protein YjeT (DUF2065 family)
MGESFILFVLTAVGLVMVMEGLLYALFPEFMRRVMAQALLMPIKDLRMAGASGAIIGFVILWFLGL